MRHTITMHMRRWVHLSLRHAPLWICVLICCTRYLLIQALHNQCACNHWATSRARDMHTQRDVLICCAWSPHPARGSAHMRSWSGFELETCSSRRDARPCHRGVASRLRHVVPQEIFSVWMDIEGWDGTHASCMHNGLHPSWRKIKQTNK